MCNFCVEATRTSLCPVIRRNGAIRELEERHLNQRLAVICEWPPHGRPTPERVARRRVA